VQKFIVLVEDHLLSYKTDSQPQAQNGVIYQSGLPPPTSYPNQVLPVNVAQQTLQPNNPQCSPNVQMPPNTVYQGYPSVPYQTSAHNTNQQAQSPQYQSAPGPQPQQWVPQNSQGQQFTPVSQPQNMYQPQATQQRYVQMPAKPGNVPLGAQNPAQPPKKGGFSSMLRGKKGKLVAGIGGALLAGIIGTEVFDSSSFGDGDDGGNDYATDGNNGYGGSYGGDGTSYGANAGDYSSSGSSNYADIDQSAMVADMSYQADMISADGAASVADLAG
jgi:hypothetical protein